MSVWVGQIWNHSWTQYPQNFNIDHMQVNYNAQYWSQVSRGALLCIFFLLLKVEIHVRDFVKLRQVKTSLQWKSLSPQEVWCDASYRQFPFKNRSFPFVASCKSPDTKVGFGRCTIRMHCSGYNRDVTCHWFLECVVLGFPGVICCKVHRQAG